MKRIFLALCMALAGNASAFPEMTTRGYNSCASCHVSPAGGGTLNDYGRSMAEELSTWAAEGEGEVGHGFLPKIPDCPKGGKVLLGGDVRSVGIDSPGIRDYFLMQADIEAAVSPVPGLWLVGGTGSYGKEHAQEFRRYYGLLNFPGDHVALRAGRFFPAYGILFPDHTLVSRQVLGWGEGQESYNAELSYRSKVGEIFLTQVYGETGDMTVTSHEGGIWGTHSETKMIARVAYYIGQTSQVGVNAMRGSGADKNRTVYGFYSITSPLKGLVSMSQFDRQVYDGEKPADVGTQIVSYEVWRGINVQLTGEGVTGMDAAYGAGLQWFPRPHFEFLVRGKRQGQTNTAIAMGHYYL